MASIDKLLESYKKLGELAEKNSVAFKKQTKSSDDFKKATQNTTKDLQKLIDAFNKNEISSKKFTKQFDELNRKLKASRADTSDIISKTKQLQKAMEDGTISFGDAAKAFGELSKACERQMPLTQKLATGFNGIKSLLGGLKGTLAVFGAGFGFEKMIQDTAQFGKTLVTLKQYAAATGQDFDKLKGTLNDLSKATGLSRDKVGQMVVAFQKGLEFTRLSDDSISRLTKTLYNASGSYEEARQQQQALIELENRAPGTIQQLMQAYGDTGAIDQMAASLVANGQASADTAKQLIFLAKTMREGKAAADSEPASKFSKALEKLQEAATELATNFGERLAPALEFIAEKLKDVLEWVKKAPDWAVFSGAAVAAIVAITAAFGPLGIAIAGIVALGGTVISLLGDINNASEETRKTTAALAEAQARLSKNAITGFEKEEAQLRDLEKTRANYAKQVAAGDAGQMGKLHALESEIDRKKAELNAKMQDKYADNLKQGKTGPGTGVLQQDTLKVQGKTAEAAKKISDEQDKARRIAEGNLSVEEMRRMSAFELLQYYDGQAKKLANLKQAYDTILNSQQAQTEFALKYNNDIDSALKLNGQMLMTLDQQLQKQKNNLAIASELLEKNKEDPQLQARYNQALSETLETQKQIKETQLAATKVYEEQKAVADASISAAESELQLSQQLYLGVGPTIDAQMKVVDLYEKKLDLVEKELEATKKVVAEQPRNLEAQKRLAMLQSEKNQLQAKELQTTKNLREGYLEALGAFTNVEGAFSKVILRREQGMGNVLRQFGGPGGAKAGLLGEGLNAPIARRQAGTGELRYAGQKEMDKLYKAAGYDNPLNRTHIGGAQAAGAAGATDAVVAGGTGARTGATGREGANAAIQGTGQSQALVDTANKQMSAIEQLNKDMPKNVAEGIKMANGAIERSGGGPVAGGATAPAAAAGGGPAPTAGGGGTAPAGGGAPNAPATEEEKANAAAEETKQKKARDEMARKEKAVVDTVANIQKQISANPLGGRNQTNVGIGGRRGGQVAAGGGVIPTPQAGGGGPLKPSPELQKQREELQRRIEGQDRIQKRISDREKQGVDAKTLALVAATEKGGGSISGKIGGRSVADIKKEAASQEQDKRNLAYQKQQVDDQKKVVKTLENQEKLQQKTSKSADETNKALDKQTQQQKEAAQKIDAGTDLSSAMALGAPGGFAGLGGGGPLGLDMGNKPTDFGLGKALGMGSGDSFGAAMFGMAEGGKVGGTGSGDTQPAMLTPGEIIMNKKVSQKLAPFLLALNKNHYALGGMVGPSPTMGAASMGAPNINLNIKGDSVNKIMQATMNQMSTHLNRMMQPHGQTGRLFELSQ